MFHKPYNYDRKPSRRLSRRAGMRSSARAEARGSIVALSRESAAVQTLRRLAGTSDCTGRRKEIQVKDVHTGDVMPGGSILELIRS